MSAAEALRKWRRENPEKVLEYQRRFAEKRRSFVREIKESSPCTDCGGYFHFSAMDFDHVRGSKEACVAHLASCATRERLLEEIAKCDLVCANCHRVRSWERKTGQKARDLKK